MGNNQTKPLKLKERDLQFLRSSNKTKVKNHLKKLYKKLKRSNGIYSLKWNNQLNGREDIKIIHYVTAVGSIAALEMVIYSGDNKNVTTETGLSPFHFAVGFEQYEKFKLLVEVCDIDIQERKCGYTCLHMACLSQDYVAVKKLLDHSANPDITDKKGNKPVDLARELKNTMIIKLLNQHMQKNQETEKVATEDQLQKLSRQVSDLSERLSQCSSYRGSYSDIRFRGRPYGSRYSIGSPSIATTMGQESGIETIDENSSITSFYSRRGGKQSSYSYREASRIQEHYLEFLNSLNSVKDIINKLFAKFHLNANMKERLKHLHGEDQIEELLDFVMKKNQETFDDFVLALRESGQERLANLIDPPPFRTGQEQDESVYQSVNSLDIYDRLATTPATPKINPNIKWNQKIYGKIV